MTEIILVRMRMQFNLTPDAFTVLRAHLSPLVGDTSVQGWEECVNSAMMHLLRTVLAKSAKDSASVVQPLKFPRSTSKLQKHLTIVLKRIKAGGDLVSGRQAPGGGGGGSKRTESSSGSGGGGGGGGSKG
jgi:Bardet-Biedl syndrome 9 protein